MAYDGSGNFVRLFNWVQDKVNAINITASRVDAEDNGFAAGLSLCVTRDGQGKMTADLLPSVDNTLNLGNGSFRWASLNGNLISSGTFTATLTGCATAPTTTVSFFQFGKIVILFIPQVTALSNANTVSLSGLPVALQPVTQQTVPIALMLNTGAVISNTCQATFSPGLNSIQFLRSGSAIGWANDNLAKGPGSNTVVYSLF